MSPETIMEFVLATIATERKKVPSLSLQHIGARDALDSVRDTLINFKQAAITGDTDDWGL